jgi:hypothetical protein
MKTSNELAQRFALRRELNLGTRYCHERVTFVVTSAAGDIADVATYTQAIAVIESWLDTVNAARAFLASMLAPSPPQHPVKASLSSRKTRSILALACPCPQCTHTDAEGVFYCRAGREHLAYAQSVLIASGDLLIVEDALRRHRYDVLRRAA